MNKFEQAVKATVEDFCSCGKDSITEENISIYAHELMKAAIQQLRDDGNIVKILKPFD